jgi:hypothetical protein
VTGDGSHQLAGQSCRHDDLSYVGAAGKKDEIEGEAQQLSDGRPSRKIFGRKLVFSVDVRSQDVRTPGEVDAFALAQILQSDKYVVSGIQLQHCAFHPVFN